MACPKEDACDYPYFGIAEINSIPEYNTL